MIQAAFRFGCFLLQPAPDRPPQVVLDGGERSAGGAVPEVQRPAAGDLSESSEGHVRGQAGGLPSGGCSHLGPDPVQGLLRRVGVDQPPGASSLLVPLDVEPEKVEALVDGGDLGFVGGQPQTQAGPRSPRCRRRGPRLITAAADHHHEVIRIADQAVGRGSALH